MNGDAVPMEQARKKLGDLADAARYAGVVTILTRHGRPVAQITPLEGSTDDVGDSDRRNEDVLLTGMRRALDAAGLPDTYLQTLTMTSDGAFRVDIAGERVVFGEQDGWWSATREADEMQIVEGGSREELVAALADEAR